MPWKQPTQITSWSFSRYSTYSQCPQRAKYLYIDKMKEPGSPAMERGNAIHAMAERYVLGTTARLPKELKLFADFFKSTRAAKKRDPMAVVVEETWAFRKDWTQTTWDDWNGCHLRVKLDLAILDGDTVTVVDHKTGKYSPQWNLQGYAEQVELYALAALHIYNGVTVVPRLHFLDHDIVHPPSDEPLTFTARDRPRLKKEWTARTRAMLNDRTFAPKPSNMCRFCSFRKDNHGPCQF